LLVSGFILLRFFSGDYNWVWSTCKWVAAEGFTLWAVTRV